MGIFHLTGAALSSEENVVPTTYGFAIAAPTLLRQKRRDAFLAEFGRGQKGPQRP